MTSLALLAVTQRRHDADPRTRFVFLAAAALAIAPLVFFGNTRFKVPVEPFLAIVARGDSRAVAQCPTRAIWLSTCGIADPELRPVFGVSNR